MNINIPNNASGHSQKIVSEEDTASKFGSGLVRVFSTPAMIALMERTAMESVNDYFPGGFGTVGIALNIKHIKASPVGARISCTSKLIKLDGKKLTFEVEARDDDGIIGSGTHTRFIVNLQEFMNAI